MRRDGHNGLHDRLLGMPTNQRRTRYARLPWRHFERLHRFARHVLPLDGKLHCCRTVTSEPKDNPFTPKKG